MGIQLKDITERDVITFSELKKKVIAIDAFNMLYQFLASIRQLDGSLLMDSDGTVTSHISGLFYRTSKFIESGIRPVFVFDGEHPTFKEGTELERKKQKESAYQKWMAAVEAGRSADILKYAQQTGRLSKEMVEDAKELIAAMGIPYIDAPSEGEAQAARMVRENKAYAVASQDYDSLLFGSYYLIRNLSITGRRKVAGKNRYITIEPEIISLEKNLKHLSITREQLIVMGILVGTDFNKGVKGIGPKTALKIVKEYKTLDKCLEYVEGKYKHKFEDYIHKVYDFFLNPPYKDVDVRFGKINKERILEVLCERHEFDRERVSKTVDKMIDATEEIFGQRSINEWFR